MRADTIVRVILLLLAGLAVPAWTHAGSSIPFAPGEKLEFVLRWENVPAGTATLEVMPLTTVDDQRAYHFVMTVRSNRVIDWIYKVRDRIDAFADVKMTRSLYYHKNQQEGRHRRNEVVVFDWASRQARYTNFGQKRDPIPLEEGSFDPLSAFYFTRTADLEEGLQINRPVTDGKKNVIGRLSVIARETITLQDGQSYETFRVEPEMQHIGGVFKESPGARIELWVTADARRIPVRIRSKVIIGHFIGELVSAEGLR